MLLSIVACLFFPLAGHSQEKLPVITLEEAVTMSKENFPLLKAKALEITKQESFKSSVLDLGTTKVFTSGDEIGDNRGIYTPIGLGQQNIDLLGISAKNKLLKQKVAVAESALLVSELQLELEVKKAWATAYVANQKLNLYKELDSVYGTFLSAVSLNYEVESISKLEYASAKNQALQISNSFRQYESEFQISLEHLNLWLASKEFYTVPDDHVEQKLTALPTAEGLLNHPELLLVSKELDKTEAAYTAAKADLLPKFNIQGGLQRVNGNSGFYSYQAGISIPLLSGEEQSLAKASKVNTQIVQLNASYKQELLTSKLQQALQRYNTNKVSWEFYKDDALQLAKQQRDGALLAYKEGAIDYAAFTQIIKEAIDVELHALQALDQYLISLFQLQYYTR
jgi:cobalt-zinc-cadmium resistance protein CzcA